MRQLAEGTVLVVETHNSRYRIVMTGRGSHATILGGSYFQEETDVRIEGSALAGSLLKVGWIAVGLFMEVTSEDKRVVTSRVHSIVVEPGPAGHGRRGDRLGRIAFSTTASAHRRHRIMMTARPRSILVAVDFGEASARAIAIGGALAERCGASLRLLHAGAFDLPPYMTSAQPPVR